MVFGAFVVLDFLLEVDVISLNCVAAVGILLIAVVAVGLMRVVITISGGSLHLFNVHQHQSS